jgi:hypothetical protein
MRPDVALAKLRKECLSHADVEERPSHGMPTWFVRKKSFATFSNDHHGDGRLAFVCAAPDGMQAALVEQNPDAYYLPPYVARLGWIGVRMDRKLAWAEIASVVANAYATVAAKRRR